MMLLINQVGSENSRLETCSRDAIANANKLREPMSATPDFKAKLAALQQTVVKAIPPLLPAATTRPTRLHQAMYYSIEAGGKRLRPALTLAVAEMYGAQTAAVPAAVAIECIHTYSLIHDDLPAMDNDDMRRGHPTCHRKFDEATAILAGDALLTHAFSLLAENYREDPALAVALVREISRAAGSGFLVGGQMEDILAEGAAGTADRIAFIHEGKTAALLTAAVVAGGLVGGAQATDLDSLRRYGRHLGLAFQMVDDILDATASTADLGKTAGKDAQAAKSTVVAVHGLESARQFAAEHTRSAVAAIDSLAGDTSFLTALARSLETRRA